MSIVTEPGLIDAISLAASPITGAASDYDQLLDRIGNAGFVLIGEASHGTQDFYHERGRITQRLIEEKGFTAVAVEGDWPDAYSVNRYVRGVSDDAFAVEALGDFRRFPAWMWRNTEVVEFVEWLRAHNDQVGEGRPKTGFYGLDLYSLHASMEAVLQYLERVDPDAANRARARYSCFDHFGPDTQMYGYLAGTGVTRSCQEEVVSQLVDLRRRLSDYARRDGWLAEEEAFYVEQNARLVQNAEEYYRSMFLGEVSSWNLRDRHMAETLDALASHLGKDGKRAKIVVWAHNSHVGDARVTEMGQRGELNIGQLARERYQRDAVLIGQTTDHGTVTAASDWNAPAERKTVRPGLPGSYEAMFHKTEVERFMLLWTEGDPVTEGLRQPLLERAIGVIYRPHTERVSHYFRTRLADQFDAVLHFDETLALEPLERTSEWEKGEMPETYPFAV
jgi:erythromycin esterase-like protein